MFVEPRWSARFKAGGPLPAAGDTITDALLINAGSDYLLINAAGDYLRIS
jgi:hypothetical protein